MGVSEMGFIDKIKKREATFSLSDTAKSMVEAMKVFLKALFKIIVILGLVAVLILAVSYINHIIQTKSEEEWIVPLGNQVEVNGHTMNVYVEGKGEKTLVFMSGYGTCSPVLDFKSLYSLLSDKYRIVVVEKAGYGFSEDSDISRDIDTMLSENPPGVIAGRSNRTVCLVATLYVGVRGSVLGTTISR